MGFCSYNRAGVERVMGFCTEEQAKHFLQMIPGVEKAIVDDGITLLKYWLEGQSRGESRRCTPNATFHICPLCITCRSRHAGAA